MPSRFLLLILMVYWSACTMSEKKTPSFKVIPITYPNTPRDTTIADTLYGKRISDPYRWLENSNTPATRDWIIQQQTQTEKYLNQIPQRAAIQKRLTALWNYKNIAPPLKKGNFYYIFRQENLQPQPILYQMRSLQDTSGQVILNLNSLGISGAQILEQFAFSQDGSLLAYEVAPNGARTNTIFVKDMESNRTLLDTLQSIKFSNIAWFRDGFFYSRYAPETPADVHAPYQFQQLFYHRVGSPQAEDQLIFADRANPYLAVQAQTTSDERFLILYLHQHDVGNALYVRDLQSETLDFTPIIEDYDYHFKVIDNINNNLLVYTNYKAPNYRLVQINTQRPEERFWENLIPESAAVLQSVHFFGGKLVATYQQSGINQVKIFNLQGKLEREVPISAHGRITAWSGSPDVAQAFFQLHSYVESPIIYTLDVNNYTINIYQSDKKVSKDTTNYDIRQVRFKSYDGTDVPLTILFKKGSPLDASRPTLLTPDSPDFPMLQMLLENGGVCAIAHVRGSSGWGEAWRQAGVKTKKQNAIDDFQAAAEYLIANKYTSPAKLAIYGKGDGGLIAGASVTQRPDLFKVALLQDAALDLLRYQQFTIGWSWAGTYGTVQKPDEFDALIAYSPLYHVVPANYPAVMILTSHRNQEVVPAHAYKFAAALQSNQRAQLPVLLRIAQGGAAALLPEQMSATTDMLALLFYHIQENIDN
ncbi:MAG: prolyl oligopeptidase family serine peptidase [Saprospiraceae bacterium]